MFTGTERLGKTEEGRREVLLRQRRLVPKARVLLIAIDGHASLADVRQHFAALGDVDALLRALIADGLVEAGGVTGTDAVRGLKAANDSLDAAQRYIVAQKFMTETAVEALGLRAFLFTLKLERCATVDDLRALLPEYERVVRKSRGDALVATYLDTLDAWLG